LSLAEQPYGIWFDQKLCKENPFCAMNVVVVQHRNHGVVAMTVQSGVHKKQGNNSGRSQVPGPTIIAKLERRGAAQFEP
jgi:hypothetical protein